jgi:hypothetical protein
LVYGFSNFKLIRNIFIFFGKWYLVRMHFIWTFVFWLWSACLCVVIIFSWYIRRVVNLCQISCLKSSRISNKPALISKTGFFLFSSVGPNRLYCFYKYLAGLTSTFDWWPKETNIWNELWASIQIVKNSNSYCLGRCDVILLFKFKHKV